jgi:BirA family biotin operon repressor/biotin-[acetyl-CoA-carboxylase] ligase
MNENDFHIIHLEEIPSTNEYVKDLFKCFMLVESAAVVADHQSAGKGQDGNSWESEPGKNILMSIVYYPEFLEVAKQFYFSMTISLGIIDFLKDLLPESELFIKWPNDIYVGNEKIGGILIYNEIMGDHYEYAVAGIGINVNQKSFSEDIPNPVSLTTLSRKKYDVMDLVHKLIISLNARYEQLRSLELDAIKAEYHRRLLGIYLWQKFMYKEEVIEAKINGVNDFGHLQLETRSGSIECDLKEIVYLI